MSVLLSESPTRQAWHTPAGSSAGCCRPCQRVGTRGCIVEQPAESIAEISAADQYIII
jgi:hypothetical protein